MRLRSIEGQPGTLQIYVTSQVFCMYFPNSIDVFILNNIYNLRYSRSVAVKSQFLSMLYLCMSDSMKMTI